MSMDVTFHEDEPLYSLNVPNYGIDSKGEDSNKDNASGGSVLALLMDICQPENGTQGERSESIDEGDGNSTNHETNSIPSDQQVMETTSLGPGASTSEHVHHEAIEDIEPISIIRESPSHQEIIHDVVEGDGNENSVPVPITPIVDYPIALRNLPDMLMFQHA
jgi:hypothetical protein